MFVLKSFSDYIALMSIFFLIFSFITLPDIKTSKLFFVMYMVFTVCAASIIIIKTSLIIGILLILSIITPFAILFSKSHEEEEKCNFKN